MQFNGLKLSGALEEFSITLQFLGSKMQKKKKKLKKKRVLSAVFLRIEVQVISNLSSRLEKHQTSKFLLINNFFMIF